MKAIYISVLMKPMGFLAFICSTDTPQTLLAKKKAKFNCVCHNLELFQITFGGQL